MNPASPPAPPRFVVPLLIAVLSVAVFLPAVHGEFLNWDDDANFVGNLHYRGLGPAQLRWMFSDIYGHYMPLTWLTLGLDYVLWGMDPTGYHATSMLLHALNAVLFFFLMQAFLRRARPELPHRRSDAASAAAALFFSLHPLRVESVSWITERRDVTAGVFFLLTLLAYVRSTAEAPGSGARRRWICLSVAAFAGMLLSKSMGMTLPLVLLVIDAVPLRRYAAERPAALIREKIPFLVLMGAGIAATSFTQTHAEALYSRDAYPLIQSVAQPGFRVSFYVLKTLWPAGLSPLYWYRPELGLPQVLGWAAILGVSGILFLRRRSMPAAAAAWLSYLILIAPVAGLFQAGPHFAADRYTYFAGLPFAALVGAALASDVRPRLAAAAASGVLVALALLTTRQCAVWKDSISLWTRAIQLDPEVYFTWNRRGQAHAARGEWALALSDYDRSIALNTGWFESWGSRARARLVLNDLPGAISDATQALQRNPRATDPRSVRGLALARSGRPREAIADFTAALEIRPQFVEARVNRGLERAKLGEIDPALADFDEAVRFDPQPHILVARGTTRAIKGDLAGAAADFAEALQRAPATWPRRAAVEDLLRQARPPK